MAKAAVEAEAENVVWRVEMSRLAAETEAEAERMRLAVQDTLQEEAAAAAAGYDNPFRWKAQGLARL